MKILKFGGSSLVSAVTYKKVLDLCRDTVSTAPVTVVVSALAGVTNQLLELVQHASSPEKRHQLLFRLYNKHRSIAAHFLPEEKVSDELHFVTDVLNRITYLLEEYGEEIIHENCWHEVVGSGEIISARLMAAILNEQGIPARAVQGYEIIHSHSSNPFSIDYTKTKTAARKIKQLIDNGIIPVMSGFIARAPEGHIITLGRDGSDFSAAIVGASLHAEEIQIWTDVAGIYTADPHLIRTAAVIPQLSYEEACQLSWLGANILHRRTIFPVLRNEIPIRILSTYQPKEPGTVITASKQKREQIIHSISYINDLVHVEFTGLTRSAFSEFIPFIYGIFAQGEIPLYDIHNNTVQRCIQLLTSRDALHDLTELVEKKYQEQIHLQIVPSSDVLIGIIGTGLHNNTLLLNEIFSLLNAHNIPVSSAICNAPAQTITIQTAGAHFKKAVQLLHSHFFTKDLVVNLYIVGPTGNVGRAFMEELARKSTYTPGRFHVRFRVAGLMNRRLMLIKKTPAVQAIKQLEETGEAADWHRFFSSILANAHEPALFVDLTGSDFIAGQYEQLLKKGIGVITANKIAFSGDSDYYRRIQRASFLNSAPLKYETTVCSATPVLHTCRSLSVKHDAIEKIEGILSGTLTFLTDALHRGISFSEAVKKAVESGIVEPHPATDLSGQDVARKLLIIIREAGFDFDYHHIQIESLVPEGLEHVNDATVFLDKLSMINDHWKERVATAEANGKRLVYLATFDSFMARVGIQEIEKDSDFARISGIENIVRIQSAQFNKTPIIVRGPGAGRLITAQGVLSDIKEAVGQLIQSEMPSVTTPAEPATVIGKQL